MIGKAELLFAVVAVVVLVCMMFVVRHGGYLAGSADRTAYYEPILRQAAEDKIAADQRADAADRRSLEITAKVETDHAEIEQSLTARSVVAESRIADLLRQHAAAAPHCGVQVPAVPSSAAVGTGAAPGDPRDGRLAERVSGVGRQCEHDANELGAWQQWYERQRASLSR